MGHVAPGRDERLKTDVQSQIHKMYAPQHNQKYVNIVRNYSTVIAGQFFGHLHSDSFRVVYDRDGRDVMNKVMMRYC